MEYAIVNDPRSQKKGRIGKVVLRDKKNEIVLDFGDTQLPTYYRFPRANVTMLEPHSVGLIPGVLVTIPFGRISRCALNRLTIIGLSAEFDGNTQTYLIREAVQS